MGRKGSPKTSPAMLATAERQAQAMELRKAGANYREIAEELGFASASGAYEAVKAALDKTLREPADELRKLELERLDMMLATIWEHVLSGDLDAIGAALRIAERRARYLGLDLKESTVNHKVDAESAKTLRELVSVRDKEKQ